MKIALINDTNPWYCPYHSIYENILKEKGLEYDVVYWNRMNLDEEGGIQYRSKYPTTSSFGKLLEFIRYAKFVRKVITDNEYDKIILFSSTIAIFLSPFWSKKMKGKYIVDYRDLTIEQLPFLKPAYKRVLSHSFANVISSPGFKAFLPSGFNYILSHNFDIDVVRKVVNENTICSQPRQEFIDVLTIGGIRDYESNVEVIDALADKTDVKLRFVGKGPSAADLENYAKSKNVNNISFTGYYKKEEEASYIDGCTFLNIFYPRKNSHDSAISNRFYHALIHKKPMIVTANTVQGDFVGKYNLGLAVVSCDTLYDDIHDYIKNFDPVAFTDKCNSLLKSFISDYDIFKEMFINFLNK